MSDITFTTADGQSIPLKKFIDNEKNNEIISAYHEEIKSKQYRRHSKGKIGNADEKNGRVIKWSKNRIWRENIIKIMKTVTINGTSNAIGSIEEAMIYCLYHDIEIEEEFKLEKLIEITKNRFAKIDPDDSETEKNEKKFIISSINKGGMARFSSIYYTYGSKGYDKALKSGNDAAINKIMLEEDPWIIRRKSGSTCYYKCLDKFYDKDFIIVLEIYRKYRTQFGKLKREGHKVRDFNINVRLPDPVIKIDNTNKSEQTKAIKAKTKMEVPAKKQENSQLIATIPANDISEKARITYYIIDKIFANPKPGTTMTINNDASIEFKF